MIHIIKICLRKFSLAAVFMDLGEEEVGNEKECKMLIQETGVRAQSVKSLTVGMENTTERKILTEE